MSSKWLDQPQMAGTIDLNPHEAPPQELKDVFKLWKGQLTPERDQNLNENFGKMPRLDSIPYHRLVEHFNRFSGHSDDANEPDVINQVALKSSGSVYSSQSVPGMKLVHKTVSMGTISSSIFLHWFLTRPRSSDIAFSATSNNTKDAAFTFVTSRSFKPES